MREQHVFDYEKLLKILPFYNVLIDFMEKPKVKKLTNVELLNELPFYNNLLVKEIAEAFKRYARSFKIEIVDKKDARTQLYSSKLCIQDLLKVLLYEMKGFKYQITLYVTLKKNKLDGKSEYAGIYFNSFIKVVINENFNNSNDKSFKEILYRLDNWINEGSGWIVELINGQYLNISNYMPLFAGSLFELPKELNNPKKELISIRNKDNKYFLWCHVRHLNLVNDHSTRIKKEDKKIADTLNYSGINFPVPTNDYTKIENQNNICVNVFSYENKTVCPIYISEKKFNNSMNVLMIHEVNKFHYVYIKDFNRLMHNKTKHKVKKWFFMRCLQYFSSQNVLNKHKENCLLINGEQKVELKSGYISFNNYSNKIRVAFKIYADFECILKKSKESNRPCDISWSVEMQSHVPCGFGYKVVCIDDRFSKNVVVYRARLLINLFTQF